MSRLLRAIAFALTITLSLSAGMACAESQLALVQRTFNALNQSSAALDRGDVARAQTLLADVRSSAETLKGNAEHFEQQARASEERVEAEARRTADLATQTAQAAVAAENEVRGLEGKIAESRTKLEKANQTRVSLENQMRVYQEEVALRNECKAHFMDGLFWSGECWRLGWADLTSKRWEALNRDIVDNNTQHNRIENEQLSLRRQFYTQEATLRQTQERKRELDASSQMLGQRVKTLKATVVSLSSASKFWRETATLIGSNVTSIETLQQNLKILSGRAQAKSPAPVFDSYDKEEVRSLQATLIDFARTIDNGTNILLAQR